MKYTVEMEIEAGSLSEAWDAVRYYAEGCRSENGTRALEHGILFFSIKGHELIGGRYPTIAARFDGKVDAA